MSESGILVTPSPTKYAYGVNMHQRRYLLLTQTEALHRLYGIRITHMPHFSSKHKHLKWVVLISTSKKVAIGFVFTLHDSCLTMTTINSTCRTRLHICIKALRRPGLQLCGNQGMDGPFRAARAQPHQHVLSTYCVVAASWRSIKHWAASGMRAIR